MKSELFSWSIHKKNFHSSSLSLCPEVISAQICSNYGNSFNYFFSTYEQWKRVEKVEKSIRERIFGLIKFMLNCLHSLVAHPNFECKLNSTSWKISTLDLARRLVCSVIYVVPSSHVVVDDFVVIVDEMNQKNKMINYKLCTRIREFICNFCSCCLVWRGSSCVHLNISHSIKDSKAICDAYDDFVGELFARLNLKLLTLTFSNSKRWNRSTWIACTIWKS